MEKDSNRPILFFDGVCGLCNGFVNFLFKIDTQALYRVAALQGKTAQELLAPERISDLDTLVVIDNDSEKIKSDAVLSILSNLGGFWKVFTFFYIVPKPLRDFVYDLVAKSRYNFFSKQDSCRMPTPEEKNRFLD